MSIYACLRYRDCPAAIEFLVNAFGFERVVVYEEDGVVHHGELRLGDSMVMVGSDRPNDEVHGNRVGLGWTYIGIANTDALYERAKAAGAEIVREPFDTDYGSRDFTVRDPEGNMWMLGTYDPATSASA
jgi:uncharacterized glyoxalase superfamily protein PhnB